MGDHLKTPAFLAFYGLLQVEARTMDRVAPVLEARTGIPMSWYEVLACLSGADAEGKRMNELADELLVSRGGATRLVARMEEAGLVDRITPPEDRRATYARLTPAGRKAEAKATPALLELVDREFGDHLDDEDLAALVRISAKLLSGAGDECSWLSMVAGEAAADTAQA
ncbi:MAG: MarR family transcriptional regulator [Solirubrobacteraceae bacterium]|nr:MarR family transcriptional regulator [Solirubrobacteraceae bacterium]